MIYRQFLIIRNTFRLNQCLCFLLKTDGICPNDTNVALLLFYRAYTLNRVEAYRMISKTGHKWYLVAE